MAMGCDILLLTEVSERVELPGFEVHVTELSMAPCRRWAAVASPHRVSALPDPHGASAMAEIEGLRVCSSILPWRSCGSRQPWTGATTAEKTASAVAAIEAASPAVWGGDWNHAMSGREWSGSQEGRRSILKAVGRLRHQLPTANAAHQIDGLLTIDHIAVPSSWAVLDTEHRPALVDGGRISDHDAYVVEVSQG
jgi:hypothetical protein